MKPANIAYLLTETVPVNFNKAVANKTAEIFEREIPVKKMNFPPKEKPVIAPYYDELHFANYE